MKIQWFPGHMNKALREMQDNLKMIDVVGYVLDSRAPFSCFNPQFSSLIQNKPTVIILNKRDLADAKKLNQWKNYFTKNNFTCVAVSSTVSSEKKILVDAFKTISMPITNKFKAKGVFKPIRTMVIGVPNSGKSTLINCISTRKATVTGDKPGVTKSLQWVRLDNGLELMDTPGTLWPKFDNEVVAQHLAYIGSIKDDIVDIYEVACLFINEIITLYPNAIKERYSISDYGNDPKETIEIISRKRGFIVSGNNVDVERGARAILDDFRKGKLGMITLDQVDEGTICPL